MASIALEGGSERLRLLRTSGQEQGFPKAHRALIQWGWLTFALFMIQFLVPNAYRQSYRLIPLLDSALWLMVVLATVRMRMRLCFPIVMVLLLQIWSIVPFLHAQLVLGRRAEFGSWHFYLVEMAFPYATAYVLCRLDRRAFPLIPRLMILLSTLSALVGILQFFWIPPGPQLASFYVGVNAELVNGNRANGLAFYPATMSTQAVIATLLIGSRMLYRKLTVWEIANIALLSLGSFCSQARVSFIMLLFCLLVLLFISIRRSGVQGVAVAGAMVFTATTLISAFPERFDYLLGVADTSNTLVYRQQKRWVIGQNIMDLEPIYGIGPDSGLFAGGFYMADKWAPRTRVVENAYLLMASMYGLVGLFVWIGANLGTLIISMMLWFDKRRGLFERRVGMLGTMLITVYCVYYITGNIVNETQLILASMLLLGWGVVGARLQRDGVEFVADEQPRQLLPEVKRDRRFLVLR